MTPERAAANLPPPVPQQTPADLVPPRDFNEARARLLRLGDDPKLVLHASPTTAFNPGDDLHP
jgi:hypothetical protein